MEQPKQKNTQSRPIPVFILLIIFITIFSIAFLSGQGMGLTADVAETHENGSINKTIEASAIASLSCLDMSTGEVRNRIDSLASDRINRLIRRGARAMPNSVRNAMANEKVNIKIGSVYFGVVTDSGAEVRRVQTGRLEGPTVQAETECQTVKNIAEAESERRALEAAISRGEIKWEGVSTTSEVATSYGSKGVQAVHILTSKNSTGSAEDAANGFTSGLMF